MNNYNKPASFYLNRGKMMNEKLTQWKFDPVRKVFVNVEKFVTYEQYENYRGKYKIPTDELLNSIYVLINS